MFTVQCLDGKLTYPGEFFVDKTLFSGQAFRWDRTGEGFVGRTRNSKTGEEMTLQLTQPGAEIVCVQATCCDFIAFWEIYFDLRSDYEGLHKYILGLGDLFLEKCLQNAAGLRLLRQDFWETLCTFIISQRNNIPKIKRTMERLVEFYGQFPTAEVLACAEALELQRKTGCGYRAEYLKSAAKCVLEGRFEALASVSYEEQKEQLKQVHGVGDKVADCVILFGLYNRSAFPVDVWIQRILDKEYGLVKPVFDDRYAGLIQQYMFYYALTHKMEYV